MAEPEIEAVRGALATYLQGQLRTQFPTVEVLARWPNSPQLPELAVSLLATGESDLVAHDAMEVATVVGSGVSGTVTYVYGYAEGIQLELDCWASTKPKRDALQLAVRRALNRPVQTTIPGADDGWPRMAHSPNLTIPVPGLYGALFTFRFAQVPTIDESSGNAQRNEWRSHFRGTADGPLWEQDVVVLRQRIHMIGNIGPGALGSTVGNQALNKTIP
jgi:hypothetical protein